MLPFPRVSTSQCYAKNQFTTVGQFGANRFFTTGRSVLAFNHTGKDERIGVLDTFYGVEFFLKRAEGSEQIGDDVLDCFEMESETSSRTAALLLATRSFERKLSVQEVDVDFNRKTFTARPPVGVSRRGALVSFEASRKWIHPTADPRVFLVASFQLGRTFFYRFTRGNQTVEQLPQFALQRHESAPLAVHVHNECVFAVQCTATHLKLLSRAPDSLLSLLSEKKLDHNSPVLYEPRSFVCSFVSNGFLVVVLKTTGWTRKIEFFYFPLENDGGFWQNVECPFEEYGKSPCPAVFVDGILCLHPVQRTLLNIQAMHEFHSYRIPIERPESLGYSAWFRVLRFENVEIDVLQRGACRPLSTTGFYLNKITFVSPFRLFIRADFDVAAGLQPLNPPAVLEFKSTTRAAPVLPASPTSRASAQPRTGGEDEEEELQRAIQQSLQSTEEQAGSSGLQQDDSSDPPSEQEMELSEDDENY